MLIIAQPPPNDERQAGGSTPARGGISMEDVVWVLLISSAC